MHHHKPNITYFCVYSLGLGSLPSYDLTHVNEMTLDIEKEMVHKYIHSQDNGMGFPSWNSWEEFSKVD